MFHSKEGLFFARGENGDVRVIKTKGKLPSEAPDEVLCEIVLKENEWASCVSSVSAPGEDYERWNHIRDFHAGR